MCTCSYFSPSCNSLSIKINLSNKIILINLYFNNFHFCLWYYPKHCFAPSCGYCLACYVRIVLIVGRRLFCSEMCNIFFFIYDYVKMPKRTPPGCQTFTGASLDIRRTNTNHPSLQCLVLVGMKLFFSHISYVIHEAMNRSTFVRLGFTVIQKLVVLRKMLSGSRTVSLIFVLSTFPLSFLGNGNYSSFFPLLFFLYSWLLPRV